MTIKYFIIEELFVLKQQLDYDILFLVFLFIAI